MSGNGKKSTQSIARVVMVSGGLASFEAARRVIERYGTDDVYLWFADTHMEDEDLYRFLDDIEKVLGVSIERMADGRNPWEVFRDERFIGNSRADPCSKHLKRQFLGRKLREKFDHQPVVVYLGFDWTEGHRVEAARRIWKTNGYEIDFPLCWEPLLSPNEYPDLARQHGVEVPRLYELGFLHNNCGGGCVKAGQRQWAMLLQTFPARYLWHEEQEEKTREYLGKDVAILVDRRGGQRRPLTLREFRERLEQEIRQNGKCNIDSLPDDGACSCFAPPGNNWEEETEKG